MYLTRRMISFRLDSNHYLLLNALSGAVDIVDQETHHTLQALLDTHCDAVLPPLGGDLEAQLRRRLYLFDTEKEEHQSYLKLFEALKTKRNDAPVQFAICPTYACNLSCSYCFEGNLTAGPTKVMTLEQVDCAFYAIDSLRQTFHPSAGATVILFGGEPLLRPTRSCVERILERSAEHGYAVEVVTNGVDADEFTDLLTCNAAIIKQIQITLDGPPDIHNARRPFKGGGGTFAQISTNVQRLLEAGMPVTIRTNVDKDNVDHLPRLREMMEEKGWSLFPHFSFYIFPVTAYSDESGANTLEEHELLSRVQRMFQGEGKALPSFAIYGFKVLGHIARVIAPESISLKMPPLFTYCEANGLRYFGFGPDGRIYPCGQALGQTDLSIGRFYPALTLYRQSCEEWATRSVLTISECRDCPIATFCGGGCAYGSYKRTSSIFAPNCQNCAAVLEAYLDRMKDHILNRFSGVLDLHEKAQHADNIGHTAGADRQG